MKHRAKAPLGRNRPLHEGFRTPGDKDWTGYKSDLDVRNAHTLFFGKTHREVQKYFGGVQSIARAHELLFVPRKVFQYYILAFAQFMKSEDAVGDSDSASSFLRLLLNREKREPGSVSQIFPQLEDTVTFVSDGQQRFNAPVDIYGRFTDLVAELDQLAKPWVETR